MVCCEQLVRKRREGDARQWYTETQPTIGFELYGVAAPLSSGLMRIGAHASDWADRPLGGEPRLLVVPAYNTELIWTREVSSVRASHHAATTTTTTTEDDLHILGRRAGGNGEISSWFMDS